MSSENAAGSSGRLAILNPTGQFGLTQNPFGKDVANLELWRALAADGGFDQLTMLSFKRVADTAAAAAGLLAGRPGPRELRWGTIFQQALAAEAGALIRGQPDLHDLAWLRRRRVGDRAYSLLGLVHTLAPPAMRQMMAGLLAAPMHPWDALICTSPSVQQGLQALFAAYGDHLAERTGGTAPPPPQLPIVPLGVDAQRLGSQADRPDARARLRRELALKDEDVLVLWVGRLSFFEKAFPQPMFKAVQLAAAATGRKVVLAMAGWFPGGERDQKLYEAAAGAEAPGVAVRFEDGNDRARLADLWAGADVFLSLVDNIQETFGITPLEAMASGLPVVASDWDGYRSTVRHGEEGFLIPTLGGPIGGQLGESLALRHAFGLESYQAYVGAVAQHTAVHVGRAAEALSALIASPDLRRRMGEAGRARVRSAFDWPVVARRYAELAAELAQRRAAAPDPPMRRPADPARGDPFLDFAPFATDVLTPKTQLAPAPGASPEAIRAAAELGLTIAFPGLRAPVETCVRAFELIAAGEAASVREVLLAFPTSERRGVELGLAWMAKYGFLDWLG